ncbi:MAG: transglycosylase SLT domain-containing protein [Candidatus Obscuribacterales bacterium]
MIDRAHKHSDSTGHHAGALLHHKLHAETHSQPTHGKHSESESHEHRRQDAGDKHGRPDGHDRHDSHVKHDDHAKKDKDDGTERHAASPNHHKLVDEAAQKIEKILKHDEHDFSHVFKEVEALRRLDPKHFNQDLQELNKKLHADKFLPHLDIIQDDQVGKNGKTERGYDVVSEDPSIKGMPHKRTIISTSHHKPDESPELEKAYHGMKYQNGQYNGFNDSVEGGHGADGGFDKDAVGGHVPDGARKELIAKALELSGLEPTESNIAAVNKIVTRESSWNPNITNKTDINAQNGHPSTGLMQTIPSTFRQYALKGFDSNIHDPLSNLIAGIRYAQDRYGHKRAGQSGVEFVASRPGGY